MSGNPRMEHQSAGCLRETGRLVMGHVWRQGRKTVDEDVRHGQLATQRNRRKEARSWRCPRQQK